MKNILVEESMHKRLLRLKMDLNSRNMTEVLEYLFNLIKYKKEAEKNEKT